MHPDLAGFGLHWDCKLVASPGESCLLAILGAGLRSENNTLQMKGQFRLRRLRFHDETAVSFRAEKDVSPAFMFPPEVLLIRMAFILVIVLIFVLPALCPTNLHLHRGFFSRRGGRYNVGTSGVGLVSEQ